MAEELTLGMSLVYAEGTNYVRFGMSGIQFDVSGTEFIRHTQLVSDSEEALVFGDVSKGGYACFYNAHATAVIQIRPATTETDLVRLEPGDIAMFRIDDGATPYVISSVADAPLQYVIIDA
jgi:hypothetical protein